MSKSQIPEKIKILLWGKAAGRCEYDGCNIPLWKDDLTKFEFNSAYIAHIIADSPDGPRGDNILSEKLSQEISNLMILCDTHHRLIDKGDVGGHPVERLEKMKKDHEERIEIVGGIIRNKRSKMVLYGANIGQHSASITFDEAAIAMLPDNYPADKPGIELSLVNSSFEDKDEKYWEIEVENLRKNYDTKIKQNIINDKINHFSVFALAPQPLLIELGRLFSDLKNVSVFQKHREPQTWVWQTQEDESVFEYKIKEPENYFDNIALKISLSADIVDTRITKVLGEDISIWSLKIDAPNNDFLKSTYQLSLFRKKFRELLNLIKKKHGEDKIINIFPAAPVAIAVEIGRVWMPKADLRLCIYDENKSKDGFVKTITIE